MTIASFQNKVFSVSSSKKYPIHDLILNSGLDTEAQEKLKDKPSTYIKGETLSTMSFEIPLRVDFGINPRSQIEEWEMIKSKAQPSLFILGSKQIGKNKWLLKSTSVSEQEIDSRGNILKAMLKLEFEEYVRAGKAKPANSGNSSESNPIGISGPSLTPNDYIYNPPEKPLAKRYNPNLPIDY